MVAAEKIKMGSTNERRGKETLVTVLIPDLAEFEQRIAALKKKIAELQESRKFRMRGIESLKSDQEFAKYLMLHDKIKSGAIKLTAEQAGNWLQLAKKHAGAANQLAKLNAEIGALELLVKESEEKIGSVTHDRDSVGEDIFCAIDEITGQTTGQTMTSTNGADIFNGLSGDAIRGILQKMDSHKTRIFSEDEGSIDWKYKEPESA